MAEKPRIPRQPEVVGLAIGSARQFAKRSNRASNHESGAEVKDQLSKLQQELEKARKVSRSLARNCARAEQELQNRQEVFNLAADHGSDLIFRLNSLGRFVEASSACKAVLGIPSDNVKGLAFADLLAPEEKDPLQHYFQGVLKGSAPQSKLVQRKHPENGVAALELVCKAMPHPQTQVLEIIGIARRASSEDKAPAIKDNLADSLAHELNQPLTALAIGARACSQLARARKVEMDELVQTIDQLALQAERAGELVRRMRLMAGGGSKASWILVDVKELIQSVLDLCRTDLNNSRIVVELHVSAEMPKIRMDRIQIEQVLVNLIRNAVEAMKEVPVAERVLVLAASRSGGELVMVVSDTGRGLSPAIADRLFRPYQTTKAQGMGLGLAISRAIVQAHAGRLWLEAARGPGATFCLSLPIGT
jgi:two-component system, LuxR family, sensor kinase FixL